MYVFYDVLLDFECTNRLDQYLYGLHETPRIRLVSQNSEFPADEPVLKNVLLIRSSRFLGLKIIRTRTSE